MTAREEIDKFKNEFASLRNASAEAKEEFDRRFRTFIRSKSPEDKKIYAAAFAESAKDEVKKANELIRQVNIRLQMDDILKAVSMSYISENYFHKSRSWFTQRLNNCKVNGIPASFSSEELNKLSFALDELGTKMKETARSITL
jgi:hypothetical protein